MTYAGESESSGIMTYVEDGTPGIIEPGLPGDVLRIDSDGLFEFGAVTVSGHNILSTTHTDTIVDTIASGDMLFVEELQEKWSRLPIGSEGQLMSPLNGLPTWQDIEDIPGLNEISDTISIIVASGASAGVYSVSELITVTTTSNTYVTIPGMSITPPSGTYICSFNASMQSNKSNVKVRISIFIDEVEILESERSATVATNNDSYIFSTAGIAEVSGVNEISIKWRRDSGASNPTWTAFGRTLYAINSVRNN